jgi:hypothetical protein
MRISSAYFSRISSIGGDEIVNMTEDHYETYHKDLEKYTFTVV